MNEVKVVKVPRGRKSDSSIIPVRKGIAMDKASDLVIALKDTAEYKRFLIAKSEIMKDPQTFGLVAEYRQRHFELQIADLSGDDVVDDIEELETLYQVFSSEPAINEYLRAEYSLSRLLQDVQTVLVNGLDVTSDMDVYDGDNLYS